MRPSQIPPTRAGQQIALLLKQNKLTPNRFRGQHFLVADDVYDDILTTAALSAKDVVLEVGPGLGTLTEQLGEQASVVAVEIDAKLANLLRFRFKNNKKIVIEVGNILSRRVADFGLRQPYKIVSNIPYYLTGSFFRKFLTEDVQPEAITVLIQKEVAERIVAKPGDMSLLGISVQLYASPKIVRAVARRDFYPPPEVESALLQVAGIHLYPYRDVPEKFFWRVVRTGFASPRKQLKNNLLAGFHAVTATTMTKIFSQNDVEAKARAEDLSLEDWHRLAHDLLLAIDEGV